MGPNGPGGPTGPSGPSGPNGPGGQQMGVGYGGGASSGGPGFNNPTGQYATQPPYHSPQMQNTPGNMGVPQRFPSGPGQGGPGAPQGRSIGNPKQALQDMIRARNDPQFSSAGGEYLNLIRHTVLEIGILLQKLVRLTVRKKCSTDREILLNHNISLKFIYSEKATKFCRISTLLLTGTT